MGTQGIIFDIKEFAVHDGKGIRTTVFFKGCPLSCIWCHNPEGQNPEKEIMVKSGCKKCGRCYAGCNHPECQKLGRCIHACPDGLIKVAGYYISSDELIHKLLPYKELFGMSSGGVTISGGEPLYQFDFLLEVVNGLKDNGINTAIETCAYTSESNWETITKAVDFVYCDLKLYDSAKHIKYTGKDNGIILKNIDYLRKNKSGAYIIRVPLIPGITDTDDNLSAIKKEFGEEELEFLPYNKMAGSKYRMLGREYKLE